MPATTLQLVSQRVGGTPISPPPRWTLPSFDEGVLDVAIGDGSGFQWVQEAIVRTQQALDSLRKTEELHRLLFEKVPHPRFVCDALTFRILAVNEAAIRHYGYSREQFLAMNADQLAIPEDALQLRKCFRELWNRPGRRTLDDRPYQHHKQDGSLINVKIDLAGFPLQGKRVFLLMAQDVSARMRAEERLALQQSVTQALAESSTLAEASPQIFQAICKGLGCDWGELWRVDTHGNVLRCVQVWHPPSKQAPSLGKTVGEMTFARGEGIAGDVWQRNRPIWITDLSQHPEYQRLSTMAKQGMRTVVAFPTRLNQEVLGVVTVFSRQRKPPDKHILQMLRNICSQVGQVMGRRRAERQLLEISEREQQRIGQDLHDGLCQQLAGIAYMASDLQSRLAKCFLPETTIAARIAELSRDTAAQARQIARGLNPVKVGTVGLVAALDELTANIRLMFSIACHFECSHRLQIRDHETSIHLYRIAQEAIHNAITHGKATQIVVSLTRRRGEVTLCVKDNGRGLTRVSTGRTGMGVENMNYRARSIGAQIQFEVRRGGGTIMKCTFSPHTGRST